MDFATEREKEQKIMKTALYAFCEAVNDINVNIWDFDNDSVCRLYGTGIKCPIFPMTRGNIPKSVENCSFANSSYPTHTIKEAYHRVITFVENNPNWKKGKL